MFPERHGYTLRSFLSFTDLKFAQGQSESDVDAVRDQMIPRIVLCMGAAKVEAFGQRRWLEGQKYDLVVVMDKDKDIQIPNMDVVSVSWVKDCLVASRLLPLPGKPQQMKKK